MARQITTSAAAAHCRVSVPTLKRWIRAGTLAAYRTPGGHYRIVSDQFHQFLEAQGMPPYQGAPPAGIRVLIADDDPALVEVLTAVLTDSPRGFEVEAATDGYEALVKVGAFKPAILILDVLMPGLDGVEVCRRLRAAAETRDMKILGLTGRLDAIPTLLAAGAHACLAKPAGLEQIRAAVEALLATPAAPSPSGPRSSPGAGLPGRAR